MADLLSPEQTTLCHQMARLASLGGFILDLDAGRCLWCADEVARMHGLPVADCGALLVGDERVNAWIDTADRERYRQLTGAARRGRGPYAVEYRMTNARGELLWLHETGDFGSAAGGGERLIGSIRDQTRERRAEAALKRANAELAANAAARAADLEAAEAAALAAVRDAEASHQRLLAAAESLVDGLAIYDADDRLVFFNSRYPEHAPPSFRPHIQLGNTFEHIVRSAAADGRAYHADMGEDFIEARLARHLEPSSDNELRIADGRWVRVRENAIPGGGRVLLTRDITERRAAQAAVVEREQRWRAIADGVPQALAIARLEEPEVLFANAQATELFGLELGHQPDAIRAMYVRRDDRLTLVEHLLADGRVDNFEVQLRRTDGRTMWALMSARVMSFDGRPAMLATATDIGGQKATERALSASEARLTAIVEHAPVGVYVKDTEGRYVLANPEMGKLFGRPAAEVIGHTAAEILPEPLAAKIAEYDRRLLATGHQGVYERHEPGRSDYAWNMVIRFPIRDSRGRITHIGGFDVDISRGKAMEQALRTSEQRFKMFAEAHPVPVVIINLDDGGVLFASPPFLELFQISTAALAKGGLAQFLPDPVEMPLLERFRRDGVVRGLELELVRTDGTRFWGSFDARLIEYEGARAVVSSVTDITERKEAEAEVERQRALLHQNEKLSALGSLLAGVAHELNNPLSVVVGHSTLLEELADDGPTRDRAGKIRGAADRCARIVRSFLAMARSKPMVRTAVRLDATIDAALEIVGYGLRTADIQLVRDYTPDLPPVWADGDQLHQVFANLLINAQQALQSIDGPRRLRIATDAAGDGGFAEVTISDNGPGIPAAIQARIFDPFFTTKPQGVGTGVGLSVCHGIVTAHGGEITAESRPGEGATFRIRLPSAKGVGEAQAVERRAPPRHTGRILVVDDELEIGQLLSDILERDGHQVANARSGREALACLAKEPVDLIICDLRMPDMDGPALYRELSATKPKLARRMVFVTGDTLGADVNGFLTKTGAPVIEKPLDPATVSRQVQALLGGAAA